MMRSFLVLLVFALSALAFTWPMPMHLDTALDNDFDTLMFASLLQFFRANVLRHPRDLLDAPFYHPHPRTLPTVFHSYMVGLAYIPIYEITRHPVSAYNILHLLTLALNGFAMYRLVRYLTGEELPGVISGFIFAFCPARVANFQYTPFVTNYWIVFSLLFLFKFLRLLSRGQVTGIALCACAFLFYLLQCVSDIIAGVYFGLAFFPVLAWGLLINRRHLCPRMFAKVVALCALLAACLAAITAPLRSIREGMAEERVAWGIENVQEISPAISSYLASPPGNLLYGSVSRGWAMNARQLNFYGAAAWLFAFVGYLSARRAAHFLPRHMLRLIVFICLAAFLLSLGPWIHLTPGIKLCPGPYMLIYHSFPMLRTLGGLGMVVLLFVCILAGFGVQWLAGRLERARLCRRAVLGTAILAVMALEYASYPPTTWGQPFFLVPREPPAVYQWLMARADDAPLIELPMPWEPEEVGGALGLDTAAMYWSAFHGRRIVNGQTAFAYPEYKIIVDQMKLFPSRETIDILRALGVRYVVVHMGWLPRLEWQKELVRIHPEAGYDWRATLDRLDRFGGELALRVNAGGDRLYEILPGAQAPAPRPPGSPLARQGWTATANSNRPAAPLAFDGREDTAWTTEHNQQAGIFFQVDLGRRKEISGIGMLLRSANECPKNPRVEVSDNGSEWRPVVYGEAYLDFVQRLLADPGEKLFGIAFPAVKARFIRITLTRMDNLYPWSLAEMEVYGGS
jgi:hypothetical protein